jgi:hypothetical protein
MKMLKKIKDDVKGKVGVPILLWLLGVPGSVAIVIWFFFFRGE